MGGATTGAGMGIYRPASVGTTGKHLPLYQTVRAAQPASSLKICVFLTAHARLRSRNQTGQCPLCVVWMHGGICPRPWQLQDWSRSWSGSRLENMSIRCPRRRCKKGKPIQSSGSCALPPLNGKIHLSQEIPMHLASLVEVTIDAPARFTSLEAFISSGSRGLS